MNTKEVTKGGRRGKRPWPRDVCLAATRAVVDQGPNVSQLAEGFIAVNDVDRNNC